MTSDSPLLKGLESVLQEKRMGAQARALEVMDNIIHMFQDPYLFYQELIQNALDARPSRIDVQFKFESTQTYLLEGKACFDFLRWLRQDIRTTIPELDSLSFDVNGYSDALAASLGPDYLAQRSIYGQKLAERVMHLLEQLVTDPVRLWISVEDDGEGMTLGDRDQFLTNLFESSKEGNPDKIGRFGIGFVSTFAIDPQAVIVESGKHDDHWALGIDTKAHHYAARDYSLAHPRKGTKVTVIKEGTLAELNQLRQQGYRVLEERCALVATPLFVDGTPINKPFDLDAEVKMRFSGGGVEGVVAIGPPFYQLFNNRMLIQHDQTSLIPGWDLQIRASSRYLSYNIGRDNVEKDQQYHRIIQLIQQQKDALAKRLFLRLEKLQGEGQPKPFRVQEESLEAFRSRRDGYHRHVGVYWDFAKKYLKEKKEKRGTKRGRWAFWRGKAGLVSVLPPDILQAKIFQNGRQRQVSVEEVLSMQTKRQKALFTTNIPLIEALLKKKVPILLYDSQAQRDMLELLGAEDAGNHYFYPTKTDTGRSPLEKAFLQEVWLTLQKTPLRKYYAGVEMSDLDSYSTLFYSSRSRSGLCSFDATRRNFLTTVRDLFAPTRTTLLLNRSHEFTQYLTALTASQPRLAGRLFALALAEEKQREDLSLLPDTYAAFLKEDTLHGA